MTGGYSAPPVQSSLNRITEPKRSPVRRTCCVATMVRGLGLEWVNYRPTLPLDQTPFWGLVLPQELTLPEPR
jgi:hypothetical protein